MTQDSKLKGDKIKQPEAHYQTPNDVVRDPQLSEEEKRRALNTWEQDERQLMTASNEGMPASEEGLKAETHPRLSEVLRAKDKMGEKPAQKPSQ
jgi:hypothetical protein